MKQIVSSCFEFTVSNTVSMTSVSHLLPTKLCIQVVGLKLVVDIVFEMLINFVNIYSKIFTVLCCMFKPSFFFNYLFLCAMYSSCFQHMKPIIIYHSKREFYVCKFIRMLLLIFIQLTNGMVYMNLRWYFNQITNFNYPYSF